MVADRSIWKAGCIRRLLQRWNGPRLFIELTESHLMPMVYMEYLLSCLTTSKLHRNEWWWVHMEEVTLLHIVCQVACPQIFYRANRITCNVGSDEKQKKTSTELVADRLIWKAECIRRLLQRWNGPRLFIELTESLDILTVKSNKGKSA